MANPDLPPLQATTNLARNSVPGANALVSRHASKLEEHIITDPEILRGKPRLKGTRIPVGLVLGYLAAGKTADEIITEFPDLNRQQIAACLDYARDLAEFKAVV